MADSSLAENQKCSGTAEDSQQAHNEHLELKEEESTDAEEVEEQLLEESEREGKEDGGIKEEEEEVDDSDLMPSLENSYETNIEDIGADRHILEEQPVSVLRRRNRPE